MALQNVRSSTADKRPNPASLSDGQLAINTAASTTGLFYKNASGALVKAGPVYIGTTAPNATPAAGGHAGNSVGETWLDTAGANPILKVWDGSTWRVVQPVTSGTVVSTADTGTVTSTMIANGTIVDADVNASAAIAGTKISPSFGAQNITTTGTSTAASYNPTSSTVPTNGVYLPAANSVGISTNGSGRLFVDASGNVGVGAASPSAPITFGKSTYGSFDDEAFYRIKFQDVGGVANDVGIGQQGSSSLGFNISAGGHFAFYGGASNGERLRITSAGLVGIGSSSPGYALEVAESVRGNIAIRGNFNGGTDCGHLRYLNINGQVAGIVAETDAASNPTSKLFFQTTATGTLATRMTLSSTGLGIGTTSPSYTLDVTTSEARLYNTGGAGSKLSFWDTTTQSAIGTNAGALCFYNSGAATERARIDSSGRLLMGTSSSYQVATGNAGQIQSIGSTPFSGSLYSNDIYGPVIALGKSRGTSPGSFTIVSNGDNLGGIRFGGADGVSLFNSYAASIESYVDGTPGAGDMPGRLVFSTTADGASSPTERMRISTDGLTRVYGAGNGFQAASSQAAGATFATFVGKHSATSTTDGTNSFVVYTNGNVQNTNNSYGSLSDLKLKENIVDACSQWDDVKALQIRKYNFKEETGQQTHTQIGLIAQEVELVSPGLVSESPDRDAEGNDLGTVTKSVNYSVLYMKAVKALQEAMERIETLEAKVAALEGA